MNLWRDIIDSLTDAILVLSPAMEPQVVNPAAETMLAVSPVTALTVADLIRQNDWLARMVATCLLSGQDLGHLETVLTIGPRELSVRAEVSPLLGAEERPEDLRKNIQKTGRKISRVAIIPARSVAVKSVQAASSCCSTTCRTKKRRPRRRRAET